MSRQEVMNDIRFAILFYSSRGWDWLDLVHFLAWRYHHEQE